MTVPTITADALRELLEHGEVVTVLDVRPAAERAEWCIPGSVHVDAYKALWGRDPAALADFEPPRPGPVVTVCARGKTSALAAERLRARGFAVRSLQGGMQAWSLAWNTAPVALVGSTARVLQVRRTGKGCLSYLVACDGEAAVIDPSVEPGVYAELARANGWRITKVLDTHVHADHLSRGPRLAEHTGAALHLPAQDRVRYAFAPLRDGDAVRVGRATLGVLHTPGHTMESSCYLLDGRALFTGDTLFLAAVGRPDLEATPDQARVRARSLYRSLQELLARLPAETLILPCHTGEPVPFDGRPLAAPLSAVRPRVAPLLAGEEAFVETIVARTPPAPPNFDRIIDMNEAGRWPDGDATELEAGANRCAVA